ncbi:MAG TPA: DNA-directed RNA polymerase subunit alpha [Phycisphaerales bacterium]|nr:DNA-directed RNA polymerase subunit alpha [Phycisphaerales bacterium]HMP36416.1 DNA-directed RNA polymerase subunit alpha [Phycisphaerales bacterium]
MHVRWRGLELPARVVVDHRSLSPTFGRFVTEPFERGFGTTIGNSLRRILLSSIEGAAILCINSLEVRAASKTTKVTHEFSTLPGVLEDVVDIVLNVKGIIVNSDSDEPRKIRIGARHDGPAGTEVVVTADLADCPPGVAIKNGEHVIATLTERGTEFDLELTVGRGRGYVPATEQIKRGEDQVIGEIPVDAIFTPVQRVRYRIEDTRVGQRTNYERLVLDIWTNGTVDPEMALVEAAKVLRKHLNPFVQYFEIGSDQVSAEASAAATVDEELLRKLEMPIADLELSVRASNCLESARIRTVGDLVARTEAELLGLRSFGRTSLREVKRKLEEIGLDLGVPIPDGFELSPFIAGTGSPDGDAEDGDVDG